jgi:hypothetical protein
MLPFLKCVFKEEGEYILREIHEGVCGNHSGARVLAHKEVRAGFYWPNITRDSMQIVKTCDNCQRISTTSRGFELHFLTLAFLIVGVDLVGPFPRGKKSVRFTVMAADYFTKWVEAEALSSITAKCIEKFLWKNVIC